MQPVRLPAATARAATAATAVQMPAPVAARLTVARVLARVMERQDRAEQPALRVRVMRARVKVLEVPAVPGQVTRLVPLRVATQARVVAVLAARVMRAPGAMRVLLPVPRVVVARPRATRPLGWLWRSGR
jgi:hypothetical protein